MEQVEALSELKLRPPKTIRIELSGQHSVSNRSSDLNAGVQHLSWEVLFPTMYKCFRNWPREVVMDCRDLWGQSRNHRHARC